MVSYDLARWGVASCCCLLVMQFWRKNFMPSLKACVVVDAAKAVYLLHTRRSYSYVMMWASLLNACSLSELQKSQLVLLKYNKWKVSFRHNMRLHELDNSLQYLARNTLKSEFIRQSTGALFNQHQLTWIYQSITNERQWATTTTSTQLDNDCSFSRQHQHIKHKSLSIRILSLSFHSSFSQ